MAADYGARPPFGMRRRQFPVLVVLGAWLTSLAATQATPAVRIVDLGTLGGSSSFAMAMNNRGQVVGSSLTTGDVATHAFSWTAAGGMIDLGTLGGSSSSAFAVNDNGQVVGSSDVAGDAARHAFSWTAAGGMVDLGAFGGSFAFAGAVNDSGQVVGGGTTPGDVAFHAFSWTAAGGLIDLGTLGGNQSSAAAVNASGQVAGTSSTAGNVSHAFIWTAAGGMVDIGTLGGNFSAAISINDSGQIVGDSITAANEGRSFSWTAAGGMVSLGTLGGSFSDMRYLSLHRAVNSSGQVVAFSQVSGDTGVHAFSWAATGGIVDLGTLGGNLSRPSGINDSGQVVGGSSTAANENHAFSWTASGGMIDLGTLGGSFSDAQAVNASGQIAGSSAIVGDAPSHAVLWEPLSATEIIADLIASAGTANFQRGVALLKNAQNSVARANNGAACGQVTAFINLARAQSGKGLTPAQANQMVLSASDAKVALGCP